MPAPSASIFAPRSTIVPFSIVGRVIGWMVALVIAMTAPAPAAAGLAVCACAVPASSPLVGRARRLRRHRRHRADRPDGLRPTSRVVLRVRRRRARAAAFGGGEARLLLLERRQPALFALAVVVDGAVDVDALGDRVRAERMVVPDDDVGVLADFERADAAVDAQLLRRVDRHRARALRPRSGRPTSSSWRPRC